MQARVNDLPAIAADVYARMRDRRPRVHCITNAVAQNFTPNLLLACGAIPSMTISRDEVESFAASADALLVNLGTFDVERRAASEIAIAQAAKNGKRWVLDPVFIERSPPRADYARALAKRGPSVIRMNAGEFQSLTGETAGERSVCGFAATNKLVVALTGVTDIISDGARSFRIENGHPLMAKVTAMGCAGSALLAAFLCVEDDPLIAAAAGLLVLGVAGEMAGAQARGPGSFAVNILDILHQLDASALQKHARVSS